MLEVIISSKTRTKLLINFFLFDGNEDYLRNMERNFKESTNAIRVELNKFTEAGLLISEYIGKKRYYKANTKHPLYEDLKQIVRKSIGLNFIAEKIIDKLNNLEEAYITGSFAKGIDSDIIELALVGSNLDKNFIEQQIEKVEKYIKRKIMYLTFSPEQMEYFFKNRQILLIWEKDIGHTVKQKMTYHKKK